jgi:hypothetical protein
MDPSRVQPMKMPRLTAPLHKDRSTLPRSTCRFPRSWVDISKKPDINCHLAISLANGWE